MTDDPEDDLQWLRYWVVLATVHMIELVIIAIIVIINIAQYYQQPSAHIFP